MYMYIKLKKSSMYYSKLKIKKCNSGRAFHIWNNRPGEPELPPKKNILTKLLAVILCYGTVIAIEQLTFSL